jgi:hypothetical protein
VVTQGTNTRRPSAGCCLDSLLIGKVTLLRTYFPVVTVEYNWDTSLGVNALKEIIDREEASFIIVLYGEARLDRFRKPLKSDAPAFHRRLSFSESSAEMNVDCRVRGSRKTHDVHDLAVNSQVFDGIQNYALSKRAKTIELPWVKRDPLVRAPGDPTGLLKKSAKLVPLRKILELIL